MRRLRLESQVSPPCAIVPSEMFRHTGLLKTAAHTLACSIFDFNSTGSV
jgi:hypothetical protein